MCSSWRMNHSVEYLVLRYVRFVQQKITRMKRLKGVKIHVRHISEEKSWWQKQIKQTRILLKWWDHFSKRIQVFGRVPAELIEIGIRNETWMNEEEREEQKFLQKKRSFPVFSWISKANLMFYSEKLSHSLILCCFMLVRVSIKYRILLYSIIHSRFQVFKDVIV